MGRHCELCKVYIPSEQAEQEHVKGKKHTRMLALNKTHQELASRSVFLYGFPAHVFTEAELAEYFSKNFHSSARVIVNVPKGTFAILEFAESEPAQKVLERKKYEINDHPVLTKPREVRFEAASAVIETKFDLETHEELFPYLKSVRSSDGPYQLLEEALGLRDQGKRQEIALQIENSLKKAISGEFNVSIFGSSVNGLGFQGSDLDLTLNFGNPGYSGPELLLRSKAFLLSADPAVFSGEQCLLPNEVLAMATQDRVRLVSRILNFQRKNAGLPVTGQTPILPVRCPVIRFIWNHEISCDLSVENQFGVNNSSWLAVLAEKEPRFRHLVFLLRYWARMCGIVGSEQHSMTSYALTLMIVAFLQDEKVLPPVSDMEVALFDKVSMEFPNEWTPGNKDASTNELLKKFFQFYSRFSFKGNVICPRDGTFPKGDNFSVEFCGNAADVPGVPKKFRKTIVNIQDPFVLTHNTTANIAIKVVQKLREQLSHAVHRMKLAKDESPALAVLDFSNSAASQKNGNINGVKGESSGESEFLIFPSDRAKGTSDWAVRAVGVIREVLEKVLQLNVESDEPDESPEKKSRLEWESVSFRCQVFWKSWEGRRLKRRLVSREFPKMPEFKAEIKTTELLRSEKEAVKSVPMFEFWLHIRSEVENSRSALEVSLLCEQKNQEFNTLCHFLKPFLLKFVSFV